MLEKVIALILIGLTATYACAPKFCVPRNELRCMEFSDPDDAFCKKTHWVYCDDDAVKRTHKRFQGTGEELGIVSGKYLDDTYKYICYLSNVYKYENFTELEIVAIGCLRGRGFEARPHRTSCRCAKDYCNGYEKQPFSERGEPSKFYSPPYNYQKVDENGKYLYCSHPS